MRDRECDMDAGGMTAQFEAERPRLLLMARRMLQSDADAEDALQDVWLRANRSDLTTIANFPAWLTTVLARICIDTLRMRRSRREDYIEGFEESTEMETIGTEEKLALAEAAQQAMAMVFETLGPAERVAFIMHDVFDFDFDEVARVLGRSTVATRQLASRARRRIRDASPNASDLRAHRRVAAEYLEATRDGDLHQILALLDPAVVLFVRGNPAEPIARGQNQVATKALSYRKRADVARLALADGGLAIATFADGAANGLLLLTISAERITLLELIFDSAAIARVDVAILD